MKDGFHCFDERPLCLIGYSQSQIHTSSFWVIRDDDNGHTIKQIQKSFGDFSECKGTGKVVARLGKENVHQNVVILKIIILKCINKIILL